ncbi:hypothetical protein [Streptomyces sioyaensis]|uniref:hypothetical protein n=1 Tax=Streptomyces sioyaensis TaxID=67364 RepID=UPI003796CD56
MSTGLPEGWTIERVRSASGDSEAALLSLDRRVVVEDHDRADHEAVQPDLIFSFHDLCLARTDGDWFMGLLEADGSVVCWVSYGSDLGEAIRGLGAARQLSLIHFGNRPW